jgi:hypothetical protein
MMDKIKRSNKMAHELDDTVLSQLDELLVEAGFDGLGAALTVLLNEVIPTLTEPATCRLVVGLWGDGVTGETQDRNLALRWGNLNARLI